MENNMLSPHSMRGPCKSPISLSLEISFVRVSWIGAISDLRGVEVCVPVRWVFFVVKTIVDISSYVAVVFLKREGFEELIETVFKTLGKGLGFFNLADMLIDEF